MRLFPPGIAVAFAALLWGGPATAQTWPVCFEGEAIPTTDAYRAFQDAATAFRGAGRFRATVVIQRREEEPVADALAIRRLEEAYLELIRAQVSPSYLRTETVARLDTPSGCLMLQLHVTPPGVIPDPPALWHLRGAYFRPGSTEIEAPGRYWIRIAAALNVPGRARYRLDGHTDTLGSPETNLELSRRRVTAVAVALVREGVAWNQIEGSAYGETRLARPTADEVAEPLNRRVWIDTRYPAATSD